LQRERSLGISGLVFLVVGLTSFDTTFMLTATFVSCVKILRALLLDARPGLDRDGHGLLGGI
jgi:hypothetical protein